eukprot:264442_1
MGALFATKHDNPNQTTIECKFKKYRFHFDKSIPTKFQNRIDDNTWRECIQHILDGISSMDSFELKTNSKISKRCAIACMLIFCSCFPSSIISFSGGLTYNYSPYYVACLILFILSIISILLFIKYSNQKIHYDNLWRIKIYNGIHTRFTYLNSHAILKTYMSFKLKNTLVLTNNPKCNCFECAAFCCCYKQNKKELTNKYPTIIITLKTNGFITFPAGTIYQFNNFKSINRNIYKQQQPQYYPVQIKQTVNIYNERLLNDYRIPPSFAPSAPMEPVPQPINDNAHAVYPFNPELLRKDSEGK